MFSSSSRPRGSAVRSALAALAVRRLAALTSTALLVALSVAAPASAQLERGAAALVVAALEQSHTLVRGERLSQQGWTWEHFELYDEDVPLALDLVWSDATPPSKIIYFLPGGGTNFVASYFTPREENLAHYFREQGYLVISITSREQAIPLTLQELAFTAGWGMQKHREDVRAVIELAQGATGLPYDVLGHSYGAAAALDYASHHASELGRVIALDIYSIDPDFDPLGVSWAAATYGAHVTLISQGVYMDATYAGTGAFAILPPALLAQDSGISREPYGAPGNFTYESYYFFGMIETALVPGVHTQLTGLANDWPMRRSTFAGTYSLAPDPRDDLFALTHLDRNLVETASASASSGLIAMAYARDYWAVVAGNGAYAIDWSAIHCPVTWLNSELGYAEQSYGAKRIQQAGNVHVATGVVPGYGHGDLLLGLNAREDVWSQLK